MKKYFLLSFMLVLCSWVIAGADVYIGSEAPAVPEKPEIAAVTDVNTGSYDAAVQAKLESMKKTECAPVPVDPNMILQGGDTFIDATVISALPYTDDGTTVGYAHDYSGLCITSTAPDVVYSFAPSVNGSINVSLCPGYAWDTGLIVFQNDASTQVGCNDDYCGTTSQIDNIPVTVGNTYYIVVTGYSNYSGQYTLNVTEPPPPSPGDNCADPLLINIPAQLPYSNNNHTCGRLDDYNVTALNYYDGGEDIIYQITVTAPTTVTIWLDPLGTTYTGILLDDSCPTDEVSYVAMSTMSGSAPHGILGQSLAPGTYYLMVDTWPAPNCIPSFDLTIVEAVECIVTCPIPNTPEGEVDCYDEYVDITNGGCNSAPPVFGAVAPGETICGTAGTYLFTGLQYRDTDWFILNLTERMIVHVDGRAEFQALSFIFDGICPAGSYLATASAMPCSLLSMTSGALAPGSYYVVFLPSVFTGVPCASNYYFTVTLETPPPPPTPDFYVTAPGTWSGNTCGALDNCELRVGCEEQIFEITLPNSGFWTFSMCATAVPWDSYIYLGSISCTDDFGYNDDFCGSYGNSQISGNFAAGVYYLTVEGYSSTDCGDYQLDVTYVPPITIECPPGAIAEGEPDCGPGYIDNFNGGCNSSPYIFSSIACGDWVCGTSGTYGTSRDTDWYRVELLEGGDLVLTGIAEFPLQILILNDNEEDCVGVVQVALGTAAAGDSVTIAGTVDPGIYWIWAGPSLFSGWDCPLDYVIHLDCQLGTPVFVADHVDIAGQAAPGASDIEPILINNTGTRTLNFTVSTMQNDVLSIGPRAPMYAGATDIGFVPAKSRGTLRPTDPNMILQGGDAIADATPITTLPYNDAGTTVGYTDNYVGSCGSQTGASDVVYSFTPAANIAVDISLCNSPVSWDSRLYVYENSDAVEIACNDDACGLLSMLTNVALTAGNTYYIVVDGYGSNSGDYVIDVVEYFPCVVTCPTPSTPEGEPDCYDGYIDATNGGCNATPNVFGAISAGETVCGKTGVYDTGGNRDTDWYLFNLTDPAVVTITGEAEVGILMGVIVPLSADPCDNTGYLDYYFIAPACSPTTISFTLDGSVPYVLFVAPDSWNMDYACGADYYVTMTVEPLWLTTDVNTGSIPAGGSMTVNVEMDAATLPIGSYTGSVIFDTNEPALTIHELPVTFTVATGGDCIYVRGDINNNGAANGIDVVYGVNYFKGNSAPPVSCDMCPQPAPFYAAGDVNGNCGFNGIDITFFVNYLKGIQPALLNCPTCPPAGGLAPAVAPMKVKTVGSQQ